MSYIGTHQQADEAQREYRKYSRDHRKDCRRAAEAYASAASERRFARWLTGCVSLSVKEAFSPAAHESLARSYDRIGDIYLRSAAHNYEMNLFYRGLYARYRKQADEIDKRLQQTAAAS